MMIAGSWTNNTIKERARAHLIESQGVKAVKSMPFAVNPANTDMIANNINVLLTQK